jgi:hypothetical protein
MLLLHQKRRSSNVAIGSSRRSVKIDRIDTILLPGIENSELKTLFAGYGFVTTGGNWLMFSYDGKMFVTLEEMLVLFYTTGKD